MKVVKIWGGIGNRLFQYFFGQYLFHETDSSIVYINESGLLEIPNKLRSFLDLNYDKKLQESGSLKYPFYFNQFYRINRKLLQIYPALSSKILVESYSKNNKEELLKYEIFDGYWQDLEYLECLKRKNNFHLSFSKLENFQKNNFHQIILNTENPVAVHIRRGDYLKSNYHYNLNLDYYDSSMEIIRCKISNPVFFIFSDDMPWVKKFFSNSNNIIIVDNDLIKESDILDFYLMTLCKHHIIANSTFSWWPAYLNIHSNAITIAPRNWYKINNDRSKHFLKEEWILQ